MFFVDIPVLTQNEAGEAGEAGVEVGGGGGRRH